MSMNLPSQILINNCIYHKTIDEDDGYGNTKVEQGVELNKLWITTKNSYAYDSASSVAIPISVTKMFYDLMLSQPSDFAVNFKRGDRIKFGDDWYIVSIVHPAQGFGPNHYELDLEACAEPIIAN